MEPDGQLSLIISNGERIDIGDHRKYAPRRLDPGMIFFNAKGIETGGLGFGSTETDSTYSSYQHLSFDQYNGDQNLMLAQYQEEGNHFKGLILQDYPEDRKSMDYDRVFDSVYKAGGEDVPKIQLNDKKGNPRIEIYVDSTDSPVMEFLNEKQEVITRIPPNWILMWEDDHLGSVLVVSLAFKINMEHRVHYLFHL